mmetsp:Transcript_17517/g.30658  ORF Transcript_17517/g.30658 Transcript_17517/m.30658 type:complete len:353 (-) Transcript_17517:159-1217(-)
MPRPPRAASPAAGSPRQAVRQQRSLHLDVCSENEITRDSMEDTCPSSPTKELVFESNFRATPMSTPSFTDPGQTIIFFDWDETLFPTTELIDRWNLRANKPSPHQQALLNDWGSVLCEYLSMACSLSAQVVIVTNARAGWVENCIQTFAPGLADVFAPRSGLKVLYAREEVAKTRQSHLPVARTLLELSPEEQSVILTNAKYYTMKKETEAFYSRYPEQTWKNVLSLGDMDYEHDAIQEVTFKRHAPQRKTERIRTKAIVLPTNPSMSEIISRLRFSLRMLPAYVAFDGDIDLDLRSASDPLTAIAEALRMPALADLPISRHAWGRESTPASEAESAMLNCVAKVVRTTVSL